MNTAIIPAAGKSTRMGEKDKLFIEVLDKPILAWTLDIFQNSDEINEVILVSRKEKFPKLEDLRGKYEFDKISKIIEGGKRRQDSVYNGLKAASEESDLIIVHDGARPLLDERMIEEGIGEARKYGASVIGVKAKDTIKEVKDGFVERTPDRDKIYQIQTPQFIEYPLAMRAFKKAYKDGFRGTDDVSLVERLGMKVKVVEGSYENIKITTPKDVEMAKKYLEEREKVKN